MLPSPGGRRGLQALCRLACRGLDTAVSSSYSSGPARSTPICIREQHWTYSSAPTEEAPLNGGLPAGAARGAKTQAGQQRGGSRQQQLRQRRAPVDAYPPVEQKGVVSVMSTKNNTIITLADEAGNVKAWSSAGEAGFKGARRATSYASEAAAQKLAAAALQLGFREVKLRMRGLGRGKQSAVKTLDKSGLRLTQIDECTPIPHNGCRPPAKRRT